MVALGKSHRARTILPPSPDRCTMSSYQSNSFTPSLLSATQQQHSFVTAVDGASLCACMCASVGGVCDVIGTQDDQEERCFFFYVCTSSLSASQPHHRIDTAAAVLQATSRLCASVSCYVLLVASIIFALFISPSPALDVTQTRDH